MASITWSWKDFWDWWESLEDSGKTTAMKSFLKDAELEKTSPNIQFEIFRYAPMVIKQNLKHLEGVKVEALQMLQDDLNKKNKKPKAKNWKYQTLGLK